MRWIDGRCADPADKSMRQARDGTVRRRFTPHRKLRGKELRADGMGGSGDFIGTPDAGGPMGHDR
jgi:hypothetical protein